MTKKMGLLVFCGVIVFTYFSCTQGTSQSDVTSGTFNNSARTVTSELKAVQYADYLTFAKQVLEKYYRNKDLGETNDFSKDVSANSLKLLNAKVEMWQLKNSMCNISYADYNISITPFKKDKWTNAGDEYSVILRIERSWFYTFFKNGVRTKSKSRTTSSEVLNIKLFRNHDGIYKILECCNHYDTTFGDLDERYQNALLNGDCLDTLLTQYKNNFKDASIKSSEQLLIDLQGESCKSDVLEVRAYTSLNRSSIVTWARNNFDSNQPISSTPLVDYYDFSEILGAYDCTNFASHALLAGGATLHDDGNSGIVGSGQWYYRSLANRSSSWAGVNQLFQFLTRPSPSSNNVGPYVTEEPLTFANASLGDIVQGHNGSIWRHSTVVTKLEDNLVRVTARIADGAFDDNKLATDVYGTQRLLHLEGNYN